MAKDKNQQPVLLPVLERELRVLARKKLTYNIRCFSAAATLLLGSVVWMAMAQHQSSSVAGKQVFYFLSALWLIFCLFEGVRLGCDALSKENREGTLGLLFLTDLKTHDIIIGKLGACSLTAFYGLLAALPMFGITILMGGITLGEFFRVGLVLIVTLLYSISLCLLVSARNKEENRSLLVSLMTVFGVTVLIPHMIGPYLLLPLDEWITLISPFSAYGSATAGSYYADPTMYWTRITILLLITGVFLGQAGRQLKKTWVNEQPLSSRSPARKWMEFFRWREPHRAFGDSLNPIKDLASRRRLHRFWTAAFWIGGLWLFTGIDLAEMTMLMPLGLLSLKIWAAWLAAADYQKARQCGALELWLTTPLTIPDIIQGKRAALKRWLSLCVGFVAAAALILWWDLIMENVSQGTRIFYIAGTFSQTTYHSSGFGPYNLDLENLVVLGMLVLCFVFDILAMSWMGMWNGLACRSITQAVMKTYYVVILVPWLVLFVPQLYFVFGGAFGVEQHTSQIISTVTTVIVDLAFIFYARRQLYRQFRNVAAEAFVRKPSLWERMAGRIWKKKAETAPAAAA